MLCAQEYAVVYEQNVAWGDMDAFGHLNNVMYYRYMESARLYYLEKIQLFSFAISPVVSSNQCQYLRPAYYPDQLKIGVRVEELRNSAFRMYYELWSESQNALIATGESVLVCIDPEIKSKVAIPDILKERIKKLEGWE